MRSISSICTGLALAALCSSAFPLATARAEEPIVIKFSHVVTAETPKGKGSERFKQLAEKYTGGRVRVEVYANSSLYKDKEELEALQLGAVQMLAPSMAKFGPLGVKEFEVFDLPLLIPSLAALRKVTEGKIGHDMLEKLGPKGLIGLAFWDNGFKVMTANKPLRSVDDFKGLKMRIQPSKVLQAQFKALGSLPQVLAFSEVYQAMQTGVVDGNENTPANVYSQKMHEVQKYLTLSNHGYIGYVVVVGKPFWENLPTDIRSQLEKAMAEATQYVNEISQQENDDAIAAIRKYGKTEIITLTPAEQEQWRKALLPVYDEMTDRVGKQLIKDIQQTVGATN